MIVRTDLEGDLPPIRVDPGQLEQALMNLALNARDAMPKGGTLTLSTASELLGDEEAARLPDVEPGPMVRLAIADTGVGMDEQVQARIFEPFFTTKEGSRGTGLGLAMVYGIVKQSGGVIDVESEVGAGTTFTLRFPASEEEPEGLGVPEHGEEARRKITGKILLIEDDSSVRQVAERVLIRAGFEVRAEDNAEAGRRLLGEGRSFDLVLTDLVLPGMGGRELVDHVREAYPQVPVVVMSGYAEGSPGSRQDLPAEVGFIQKPFTPDGLLQAVREGLRGS